MNQAPTYNPQHVPTDGDVAAVPAEPVGLVSTPASSFQSAQTLTTEPGVVPAPADRFTPPAVVFPQVNAGGSQTTADDSAPAFSPVPDPLQAAIPVQAPAPTPTPATAVPPESQNSIAGQPAPVGPIADPLDLPLDTPQSPMPTFPSLSTVPSPSSSSSPPFPSSTSPALSTPPITPGTQAVLDEGTAAVTGPDLASTPGADTGEQQEPGEGQGGDQKTPLEILEEILASANDNPAAEGLEGSEAAGKPGAAPADAAEKVDPQEEARQAAARAAEEARYRQEADQRIALAQQDLQEAAQYRNEVTQELQSQGKQVGPVVNDQTDDQFAIQQLRHDTLDQSQQ